MTALEIMEIINKAHEEDYNAVFGIRTDDASMNIGDACRLSHEWDYENGWEAEGYMDGTCATGIGYLWFDGEQDDIDEINKALEIQKDYQGAHQYVVMGSGYEYGNDPAEIVMTDAKVIAVLR